MREGTTLKDLIALRLKVIDKILKLTDHNRQFVEVYHRALSKGSEDIYYDGVTFDKETARDLIARSKSIRRYRERRVKR